MELHERLAAFRQEPPARHRLRRTFIVILVVLTVMSIIATAAAWLNRTALDTGRFMGLTEPVLDSPEAADALSVRVTNEVLGALALEERLEARPGEVGAALSAELAAPSIWPQFNRHGSSRCPCHS